MSYFISCLIRQIVPYQTENTNLVKISSADLFGQVVIWNLNGKVSLSVLLFDIVYLVFYRK